MALPGVASGGQFKDKQDGGEIPSKQAAGGVCRLGAQCGLPSVQPELQARALRPLRPGVQESLGVPVRSPPLKISRNADTVKRRRRGGEGGREVTVDGAIHLCEPHSPPLIHSTLPALSPFLHSLYPPPPVLPTRLATHTSHARPPTPHLADGTRAVSTRASARSPVPLRPRAPSNCYS